MAGLKVSLFNPAAPLTGTEIVGIVQGAANAQTTTADIAALGGGGGGSSFEVNVRSYGAVGDGVTNDGAAFVAAIAALKAAASNDATIYKGSNRLRVPAGHYFLGTTTLDITHTLIIEGEGTGLAGGNATKLRWSPGATGIRVQRANTSGEIAYDAVLHYGGDATTIRGLFLEGGYTNFASEGEFHAINFRSRVLIEDCFAYYWQGDGFHTNTYAGIAAAGEGNSNQFVINRCTAWYCRNGFSIDGADANAGTITSCDASYNRQWGFRDSSFLGNTYIGTHDSGNGITATGGVPPTVCSYSGNTYQVITGQEAGASTNAPSGTTANNTWWLYYGVGGAIAVVRPLWVTALTWRAGGAKMTDDPNASNVWIGCYSEGGQAGSQLLNGVVIGGTQGVFLNGASNYGAYLTNAGVGLLAFKDFTVGRNLTVTGAAGFGPTTGSVADLIVSFNNTSTYNTLDFKSWSAGVEQTDGTIFSERDAGLVFNGKGNLRFRRNNVGIVTINANGLDLAAGKVFYVNGTQVVGAQGAAVADAAALTSVDGTNAAAAPTQAEFNALVAEFNKLRIDLGATRTALNALLARDRAHGLIAT